MIELIAHIVDDTGRTIRAILIVAVLLGLSFAGACIVVLVLSTLPISSAPLPSGTAIGAAGGAVGGSAASALVAALIGKLRGRESP